ncbi:MAG: ATP-binding cassette domain-containing protein, partial [Methanomassiliicoccales archaeon]
MAEDILLDIRNLRTNFYTYQGVVKALDGINLSIRRGETFGLVGETGCGKSVTANSILRLIPIPPGKIEGGSIYFSMPEEKRERLKELQERLKELKGLFSDEDVRTIQKYIKARRRATSKERVKNLTKSLTRDQREYIEAHREFNQLRSEYDILRYNNKRLLQTRGNLISMIFQEPMSSLNPVYTAGDQISESILLHEMQKVATMTVHKMDERKKQLKEFKRADKRATDTGESQCSNCKTVIGNGAETCPQCGSSFTSE